MATKDSTKARGRSTGNQSSRGTGRMLAAAAVGAAAGAAAMFGRKFLVQGISAAQGDWDEALAAEHRIVAELFDALEATSDNQTAKRTLHLTQIKHALGKHALEEENVIYPALREHQEIAAADTLNTEHGYVKTYLYELENMPKEGPAFLAKVREFRTILEAHIREEENEIFPALKRRLSEVDNGKLTHAINREGLKLA